VGDHGTHLKELARIMREVSGIRRFGAASLDLAYVAAGRFDGFWETHLSPWDMAAGMLLVKEAGGFITDIHGREAIFETGTIVAGNEYVNNALVSKLKEAHG
jgi:myo-inositol-1(or 4)-monophosphatase